MDQKYLCNSAPECPFNSAQLPVFVRVTGNDGYHTKSLLTKCLGVQFVEGRTQIFSLEGARSGVGSVEWVPPFQRGGVWEGRCPFPSFFLFFRWKWCILVHLYLKSKLVSRSQLRRPRHEEQRQSSVRSNTEATTGEAMSSQGLKSTRSAVSAIKTEN